MEIVLETARLVLRKFVPADAQDLAAVLCDRENMRFYPNAFEPADADWWIARNIARYRTDGIGLWAAILKEEDRFIGDCGLTLQAVDGIYDTEIGYHFRRDYHGRGFATEAARACRDYGFSKLGRGRLISLIRPMNIPSRRVAERTGLTIEKETLFSGLPHLVYAIENPAANAAPRNG